jgi:hypothetical protein
MHPIHLDPARRCKYGTLARLHSLLILVLVAFIGCSDGRPKRVAVSGKVLIDGKPVTRGEVKFVPEHGRPAFGNIGPDGSFTLSCYNDADGALLGKHRVQVDANRGISDKQMEIFTPKHYADFRTSGIEVDISQPIDDLLINLTWGDEKKGPYIERM